MPNAFTVRTALAALSAVLAVGCGRLDDALSPGRRDPDAQTPARIGLTAQLPSFARGSAAVVRLRVQATYRRADGTSVTLGGPQTLSLGDVATQQVPLSIDLAPCLADPQRESAGSACVVTLNLTLLADDREVDAQTVGPLRLQAGATSTVPDPVQLFEVATVTVTPADGAAPPAGTRLRLELGNTLALNAAIVSTTGQTVTGRTVTWQSDAPSVARVDPATGMVTALTAGRARVTASFGAASGGLDLAVAPRPSPFAVTVGGGHGSGTVRSSPAGIDCRVLNGQAQPAPSGQEGQGGCAFTFPGDAQVTLTATPDAGTTQFAGWGDACASVGAATTCVLDASTPRAVSVQFAAVRKLAVGVRGTGAGIVKSAPLGIECKTGDACGASYVEGTKIRLTAVATAPDAFVGWTGVCEGTSEPICDVGLDVDAVVGADFSAPLGVSILLTGNGGGTIALATPGSSTPVATCTLARGVPPAGACGATVPFGTIVTLTATANPTSIFAGWTGLCSGTGACRVNVNQISAVGAVFTQRVVTLTLNLQRAATGGAGTVTANGAPACALTGPVSPTSPDVTTCTISVPAGDDVALTATPAAGSDFIAWNGCTATGPTCTIAPLADAVVTASFAPTPLGVTIRAALGTTGAGTVTSRPAGIVCGIGIAGSSCSGSFPSGTTVVLTATPSAGSTFGGWGGACAGTTGQNCTVTLTAGTSVSVQFTLPTVPTFALSVSTGGTGDGTVTSPVGISCPGTCSTTLGAGTVVTLTAAASQGSTFGGWGGACSGTAPTCAVTMDAVKSVTASFSRIVTTFPLGVTIAGTGTGAVSSSPGSIDCPGSCTSSYAPGTVVTLTALPGGQNVTFGGWDGACVGSGTSPTCTITMDGPKSVTALFSIVVQPLTLDVSFAGTGSGAVGSSPSGIDCPGACTASFAPATSVTLTATPGSGSTFTGWSGACSGTGACVVTMDAAKSVTATFTSTGGGNVGLSLNVFGAGVTVTGPNGINCPGACGASFPIGTQVTLTVTGPAGATFAGWGGACASSGTAPTCTLSMGAPQSVTATFTTTLTLTMVGVQGSGTVTSSPAGINCAAGGGACPPADYPVGTVVTLTAVPGPTTTSFNWSGACTGSALTCTVTMSQATSVTAQFRKR
ncbi:InlB B-repeat-containing protein [Gemmatirosa kalamazoonensis]|uniref:InlB B-repeat-containing protein n=1 Tax=Gemmatirosa kalamazoonensis TaxID=861299 RepID=UPI00130EEDDD|nr:Ig-like domain-containing protein [Gemmatirosa kalamazoonensis]